MDNNHHRDPDGKPFVEGFMTEKLHSQKSPYTASGSGHTQKYPFRDPPLAPDSFFLVRTHKSEGNGID